MIFVFLALIDFIIHLYIIFIRMCDKINVNRYENVINTTVFQIIEIHL